MTSDQYLNDLQPKQTLRQTDKLKLTATLLTMVPPEKEYLSNEKKIMKIGALFKNYR